MHITNKPLLAIPSDINDIFSSTILSNLVG